MTDAARKLEIAGFKNTVDNYRRANKTDSPAYHNALRKLELYRSRLDLEKTKQCVVAAARERRFVSYKDVADVSGLEMSKAYLVLTRHLGELCSYSHSMGLPLLSAIVVNVDGVGNGKMSPKSKAGFIKAAKLLGVEVPDEDAFVTAEQERVFAQFAPGAAS